jgi:mannose-1-phosphate guanylyltransferase
MKAFLLAAGEGTRLRPLTHETPKCLVPVSGRPLLEYWFDLFERYDIKEILVNTSHLAGRVKDYIEGNSRNFMIHLTYEEELLGSGGTIKKNWEYIEDEKFFFIFYADNLTNVNINRMIEFHNNKDTDFTIALCSVPNPGECGIVELDRNATVISFTEKPENPASDLAFAGIMISNKRLKDYFPDKEIFDLGYDVLPHVAGHASGFVMDDYLVDIGTHEKLAKANHDVQTGAYKPPGKH